MEKKNETAKKPRFSPTWKALTIVISLIILYTVYHIFFGLTESVKTTPTGLVQQSTSVILEGVIFREEETISTKNNGDMRPYFYDGERVSVDSCVAAVYTGSGNASANDKIAELEQQLDILKRSNVKGLVSIVDIENIKADIDKLYSSFMLALSDGDNYRAHRIESELLVSMNKLRIYQGEVKNYNDEIAAIEDELDTLYNSFKGDKEYIFADKGGYFYHSCDGYEQALSPDRLAGITLSELKSTVAEVKDKPITNSDYKCKFVYGNTWRMATYCDNATAALLEEGKQYSATLFDIREYELTFTLEKIGESNGEETMLVFSCLNMPDGFDFTRYQSFKLDISSIEGYRVPKEALVSVVDKETGENKVGVYIINASVVYFRRVDIIAESEGYYIVAKLDKSKENYREYLALNDLIVLETKGMFDGKVLTK